MADVSIRDLRNHGGEVVDRVTAGERLTVTRSGKPVAVLSPLSRAPIPVSALIGRRKQIPVVNPAVLRRDIDAVIDESL